MFFYEDHQFDKEYYYNSFVLENTNFPSHFHRTYELIFVSEGSLVITINNREYLLGKNELAFIFPNQLHSFTSEGFSHIVLLIFPQDVINSFYQRYQHTFPESNVITYESCPHEKLTFGNIFDCKAYIYEICSRLINTTVFIPYSHTDIDNKNLLYAIINYVQEYYKETCTLAQVSKELGYDYSYLSKFFQEKLGLTFTSYLNQFRISQACFMLHNTSESISSIAMQSGYDTIRTFNRNFKLYTGFSPSEYKRL